ncbi:TIGR00725 family protein [candidate division WOR-3 bacterium]|nr:TIGR00725 family protein [candidate division WOR-3 bacterium]
MNKIIGVIGGSSCSKEIKKIAFEVGCEIAKKKALLICGGLSGVMEAVCKGAKSKDGITIGVLPGKLKSEANKWVDIPIVTGIGVARNVIIVRSSDSIIAINGRYGTLSELAIASNLGIPIVGLKTWDVDLPIKRVNTPKEAVELAIKLSRNQALTNQRTII